LKKAINTVLFAYNFPHQKTIDVIHRVYQAGFSIALILAADYVFIKSPISVFKFNKPKSISHPEKIAKQYNIPFFVLNHNSEQSIFLLKKHKINLGIIGGARILKDDVIQILKYGILNFHPGILPYIRGLDSILWSIEKEYPIGVTAHLINKKIDAGFLVCQQIISISSEDDIYSLYKKNYELQLELIPISLNLILEKNKFKVLAMGEYNQKMSCSQQLDLKGKVTQYINKYIS
tara:strand:+ start:5974 stop:6675 length:702 start_codon:yes stop_codon:yes gene_type:complete